MNYNIDDKVVFKGKETTIKSRVKEYPSKKLVYQLTSGEIVSEDEISKVIQKTISKSKEVIEKVSEDISEVVDEAPVQSKKKKRK